MRVKILKIISIIFVIISLVNTFNMNYKKLKNKIEVSKVINNITQYKNEYNSDIIGYLEISNLKIKNIIIEGVGSDILDQNVIGILPNRYFCTNDDIFLAGHNIEEVFKKLHNISIGEIIKITTKNSCYRYKVVDIKIINETETSYLKNNYSNKLFLMTCTNIKRKRLLVIGDLI